MDRDISYFGETNNRSRRTRFGIRQADRLLHTLVLGKTGTGKSTLLATLAMQDIEGGRGCAVIDPHGDLVERLYREAPAVSRDRIVYFNAPDPACPYGYNPLRRVPDDTVALSASGLMETMEKQWPSAWGVRMEHVLRNSLYTLLSRDGSTLPDLLRLYYDPAFRADVVGAVPNPAVRQFWRTEFDPLTLRQQAELIAPIQNKLGALLSDPAVFRILAAPSVDLNLRTLMDEGKVLLVNLSRGQLGEDSAGILGSVLVSTLGIAAFSRADVPETARRPFFLYVDEFHSFSTRAFALMVSELRKTRVGLVLASQYLHAIDPDIRHAVLGNAGTLISFRVGPEDAGVLAKEFQPKIGVIDLVNLPNFSIYLKLMIEGAPSQAFSACTRCEIS
jgi:DNA helicase HerA-like ATPase